jgi:hypothetical protein
VPHYDARKALHDPNPLPRLASPLLPPVALDVERMAARAATAVSQQPPNQWSVLERVYVDRLLDHLEERHEPADVDMVVDQFVQVLRVRLAGGSDEG